MKITRVGVDLAKNVFQVHGVNRAGRCVWKRQLKRSNWLQALTEKLEPGCEIGMEACGGSHHWARELRSRGFIVKLVSPQFVKPFVKSQKNDANDAEAVCEAISRPSMRSVISSAGTTNSKKLLPLRDRTVLSSSQWHQSAKGTSIWPHTALG